MASRSLCSPGLRPASTAACSCAVVPSAAVDCGRPHESRGTCTMASPTTTSSRTESSEASIAQVDAGLATRSPSISRIDTSPGATLRPRIPRRRGARCGAHTPTSSSSGGSSGSPCSTPAVRPTKNACETMSGRYSRARRSNAFRCARSRANGVASASDCSSSRGLSGRTTINPRYGCSRSRARRRRAVTPAARACVGVNIAPSSVGKGRGRRVIHRVCDIPTPTDCRLPASVHNSSDGELVQNECSIRSGGTSCRSGLPRPTIGTTRTNPARLEVAPPVGITTTHRPRVPPERCGRRAGGAFRRLLTPIP